MARVQQELRSPGKFTTMKQLLGQAGQSTAEHGCGSAGDHQPYNTTQEGTKPPGLSLNRGPSPQVEAGEAPGEAG